MFAAMMPATFKDIGKTRQIGIDISLRIDERVADTGLRREMHDERKLIVGKKRRDSFAIGEIHLDEAKVRK